MPDSHQHSEQKELIRKCINSSWRIPQDEREALAALDSLFEQLEAALRVVEAAHIAYNGFGEDDHEFYGSQMRLAGALGAYDERYPASRSDDA